mmetsp:Transcript_6259/g.26271  ORF Transcript_6259/g.26271 Transcript_6259/m.26271 type:complete len:210 (-) Transcript_6259:304-933(-)
MAAESKRKRGRGELWSPSTMTRFLSPAYLAWIAREWCAATKSSCSPATKSAGTKDDATCLTGATSSSLNLAVLRTELRIMRSASDATKPGTASPPSRALSTSSSASCGRSAKAPSQIIAATDGSRAPCINAQTAPIDRPHRAIDETEPVARRCAMTVARSSRSQYPSETHSPSECPEPLKSKATSVIPIDRHSASCETPSTRADALPWR